MRVQYNVDALDFSAFGGHDALNPALYDVSVLTGAAPKPGILRVDRVAGSTVAFDIFLDTLLLQGATYRLTVASVTSEAGDPLGFPTFLDVPGNAQRVFTPVRARATGADLAIDMISGRVLLTDSGDYALFSTIASVRDRVTKRIIFGPGSLYHAPTYGRGFRPKARALNTARLANERNDLLQQLRLEDDLVEPDVSLTISGSVLRIDVTGRAAAGQPVAVSLPVQLGV